MNFALGTGNLTQNYDTTCQEVLNYCVSRKYPLHVALDYPVNKNYLSSDNFRNISPKFILKITVIKNIFKLKNHIENQIYKFLKLNNLKSIECVQLCNNPSKNFIYQFFLKKIIKKFKEKKIISKVFLDVFPDYEKNLKSYLDDKFYAGFVFLFNYNFRSISKNFLCDIIKSDKKIIVYSPFSNGKLLEKDNKVMYNLKLFNTISNSIDYIIFGTKNLDRIKVLENVIKMKNNIFQPDQFDKIVDHQKIFNKY